MVERERRISELEMSVTSQQQENVSLSSLQKSLEATRAHLQKTLRQKEADCNRMAVQIRVSDHPIHTCIGEANKPCNVAISCRVWRANWRRRRSTCST